MNDLTIKSATPILKLKEPIGKLMIQFDDDQPEKLVDVYDKVVFARQLLNKSEIVDRHTLKPIKTENIIIRPNSLIDVRCIDIYNLVTKDKVPPKERVGHWAQEFYDLPGLQRYVEGQFRDVEKVQRTIDYMKKLKP